ncbi:50S ribosomal protein L25/general stress protein Ctc [Corallincola luteus]|uniref:Large ribosomal subunit protein bL25 n=2 Tax=Corallincola TaxID=1775176 RepID=A0A368NFY6_9GAMM|nr:MULTISPECIES: 50S ribosomal protein L25/general stress protein Ctc [Corallincola]RCU48833.1 50S ribosomal protein L25/general stress protein Ctc [Corallincola holothuriorum]TCI02974.1 50S ribosomal protein L25/general stress protein Ctc [Corallincola luteus]
MSDLYTLDAEIRTDLGKGASRRLRHADKVPAVLYGGDKEAVSLTLAHNKVFKASENEGFYSHILTLNIGGEKVEALLKDVQRHVYKPKIMHLDFLRVDATHEIHTKVPVHFLNEDTSAAVKAGGVVVHHITEVEVACLPKDLPEFIEVDVADLEQGSTLHLSDIKLPEGVVLVELGKGEGHDQALVGIAAPKGAAADDEAEAGDAEEAASEE